jgi:hypothetical protein
VAGQSLGDVRGVLRVNAPVFFAQTRLGTVIAEFLVRHPRAEVDLSIDDRILDVVSGGYDVVLRVGRLKDSTLVARKLVSERLVVVGSPDYLAKHGEPTEPEQLVDHECLHYALVPRTDEWRFWRGGRPIALPTRGRLTSASGRCWPTRRGRGGAGGDPSGGRRRTEPDTKPVLKARRRRSASAHDRALDPRPGSGDGLSAAPRRSIPDPAFVRHTQPPPILTSPRR